MVLLKNRTIVTRSEAMRVDRFIMENGGIKKAAAKLRVGEVTLANGNVEGGIMLEKTKARLLAAIDAAEAAR